MADKPISEWTPEQRKADILRRFGEALAKTGKLWRDYLQFSVALGPGCDWSDKLAKMMFTEYPELGTLCEELKSVK